MTRSARDAGSDNLPGPLIDRRRLLRAGGLAALGAGVAGLGLGCASPGRRGGDETVAWQRLPRRFRPVKVHPRREIRTVVGLRPFRPSGFRLEAERLDDKLLVHDYGHGGGGVSLSWGTAHLAVEMARETSHRTAAVIGCGAVGLATARLLQRRGWEVTIYARDLPPETTSNVAGAQWSPYTVHDDDRVTVPYHDRFVRASRLANRYFQDLVGDRYGVRWIENYVVSERPMERPWFPEGLEDLYPDARALAPDQHPFDRPHARVFTTMLIEPPTYLNALLDDFRTFGGRLVVREFRGLRQLAALDEPVIMNCTGLGARELVGDDELLPIKGQLTFLLPQPEVDYIVLGGGLYMFPRTDGILLGGTHERGEWSLEPNLEAKRRILTGHGELFDAPAFGPSRDFSPEL